MSIRRKLVIGLIIGMVGMLGLCGIAVYTLDGMADTLMEMTDTCDPKTPKNTEELGQFKFPPSTRNLQSSCFGMQGWSGYATFEMLPSDLQYFVSHSQLKEPLTSVDTPVNELLATKASTATSHLQGSYRTVYENGDSFWQDILIDTSDPNLYVVYVDFSGG